MLYILRGKHVEEFAQAILCSQSIQVVPHGDEEEVNRNMEGVRSLKVLQRPRSLVSGCNF